MFRATQVACVPSARYLRRLRGHPRTWPDPGPLPEAPPPVFPLRPITLLPSGWAPATGLVPPGVPFRIDRTKSLQLPVYTDYKHGRTKVITQLRKYSGDVPALRDELSRVLGGSEVAIKNGRLEVEGNRTQQLKTWLMAMGF